MADLTNARNAWFIHDGSEVQFADDEHPSGGVLTRLRTVQPPDVAVPVVESYQRSSA